MRVIYALFTHSLQRRRDTWQVVNENEDPIINIVHGHWKITVLAVGPFVTFYSLYRREPTNKTVETTNLPYCDGKIIQGCTRCEERQCQNIAIVFSPRLIKCNRSNLISLVL